MGARGVWFGRTDWGVCISRDIHGLQLVNTKASCGSRGGGWGLKTPLKDTHPGVFFLLVSLKIPTDLPFWETLTPLPLKEFLDPKRLRLKYSRFAYVRTV